MTQKELMKKVLVLNPQSRIQGKTDIWMEKKRINLPIGAKFDGVSVILDGVRIRVYLP